MPDAKYIAISFSVEDLKLLEELSDQLDATIASVVRGMVWHVMDNKDLMATIRPARHVHNKKKWRKSISLRKGDQSDNTKPHKHDREPESI
jgi:hypothetical protein